MVTIKIKRDEARLIEKSFLPYLILRATTKINDSEALSEGFLSGKILYSLLSKVKDRFEKKLRTDAVKFKIKIDDAEGIAFYSGLMNFPIEAKQVYMITLRQRLCDQIHQQLLLPVEEE